MSRVSSFLDSAIRIPHSEFENMATFVSNVREYCALLSRSRLLPADEVDTVYRRWRD